MSSSVGKVVVRKAGEALTKKGGRTIPKHLKPGEQLPLTTPRAVSAEEAPYILPARESTKTTMMPWRGWVQRWIKDTFGEEKFQKFRETVFFMPDDIYDLNQAPFPANKKIPISKTDPTITHSFRYPSPGSQPAVNVPRLYDDEDPYDSAHFKRDTRRRYEFSELGYQDPDVNKLQLELMKGPNEEEDDPEIAEQLEKLGAGPESSPGNQGRFATGPTDFDPTGLRASMSVTWEEANKELDKHMPDHLPYPTHVGKEDEWTKWYVERDLPVPMGDYYEDLKVPRHLRVARW